jgi:hypothetical protein
LIHFNLSLFVSFSFSFWLNWMCETDWNWQSTQIYFVELIVVFRILECHEFLIEKMKEKWVFYGGINSFLFLQFLTSLRISDENNYRTNSLDGSWINRKSNLQQEIRCLVIWNC